MNKIKFMSFLLASLMIVACKDSDNDNDTAYTVTSQSDEPQWHIDWSNNQERPNWTEPDASLYENWTILKVQIEDALKPYVSENDLMAIFVNGELRGLANPAVNVADGQTANGKFLMKAYGNETGTETVNMSLKYYSHNLKHIFTLSEDITLNSDETTGIDDDFIPEFIYGSAKYPLMKTVNPANILTTAGITPAISGIVGAFVGNECRGTATITEFGNTSMVIFGCNAGESVSLKYYDSGKGLLYTIPDAVKF